MYRLHSNRERSFTTKSIAKWCESRQVHQTLNARDEPEANGRVEGEVHQFKRRLRLLLRETGVAPAYTGRVRLDMVPKKGCALK